MTDTDCVNRSVLVVDDDFALRQFLTISLQAQGYTVLEASTGMRAVELVLESRPELVLLDLGLPDLNGLEVIRRLRTWTWLPIIVISVQNEEAVIVEALDLGADDYLVKPFKINELSARLRAAHRRTQALPVEGALSCGSIFLDQDRRLVTVAGEKVPLTPNEFSILLCLMQNQGRVVTHGKLLSQVWGPEFAEDRQLLRVHISNLRKKLEVFPCTTGCITNETGVGYRLLEEG